MTNENTASTTEQVNPTYTDQLTQLVAQIADGREFSLSCLRLVHFVKCNLHTLESELLGQ